jgi:putative copper export protein
MAEACALVGMIPALPESCGSRYDAYALVAWMIVEACTGPRGVLSMYRRFAPCAVSALALIAVTGVFVCNPTDTCCDDCAVRDV